MEVKILDKGEKPVEWVKFVLKGKEVTPAFANAIRRIIRTEVPCLSIEDVIFKKNNSILYDEMLGLRFGLMPISTPKGYVLPSECGCGSHCPKCSVSLLVKKKGPGWVYGKDLKSSDPKAKPVFDNTLIVYLEEWQELEAEAIAQMGVGRTHMKWQAALPGYQYYPQIKVVKPELCKSAAEVCPRDVFEGKTPKVKNLEECNLCMACVRACPEGAIEVTGLDDSYIFYVESFGQYEMENLMEAAAGVLEKKANEFIDLLEGKAPKKAEKK